MERLFERIKVVISGKPNAVIGIDGRCASGKTTLASCIAEEFNAQIIQMDNFFLPFEMRTQQRLSETGGNVHYERFNAEVASGLAKGVGFAYRVFNCKYGDYTESKLVLQDKPVIIEGSYAFHPKINLVYDLKIFMKADYETRLSRICQRNGEKELKVFRTKWIPLENKYFDEFNIEKNCDIIIKQTER